MTITMNPPVRAGGSSWRFTWTSDSVAPTFYIYNRSEGALIAQTTETALVISLAPGEAPVIEVREDAYDTIPRGYPSRLLLFWYAGVAVKYYRIEEYVGAAGVARARIYDRGEGHYQYRTRALTDAAAYSWRIIPVGTNGNDGTAVTWTGTLVTYPLPPQVTYGYSDITGAVTITAD